jgi:hypothetical protein
MFTKERGQAAMYQRYPGDAAQSREPTPSNAPQSILRAVRVMYVGAALSLIGIIVDLTTLSSERSSILKAHPGYTTAQINSAEHAAIGLFIAGGLIGAALWLWMAQSSRGGKGWARIVATVLFGIDTLSQVVGVSAAAGAGAGGGLSRLYGLIIWVVGVVAIVLLWQRSSSEYFRAAPR